jgi:hypothetical protein
MSNQTPRSDDRGSVIGGSVIVGEDKKAASEQPQNTADQATTSDAQQPLSPVLKGLKYGAYTGVILGLVYVDMNTLPSLGFYDGSVIMVCAKLAAIGAAIGALFGWLSTMTHDDE